MRALWLDRIPYQEAWQLQRELAALRSKNQVGDTLLLLEHPPTITLGRGALRGHVLASPDELERLGVEVAEVDRGGDVTYHGPGQLVGYPVFDLTHHGRDLHAFLRAIEEALIRALARLGIEGRRFPPHTGVWVGNEKIAAIGIKVSRWVSTHGFALNVAPSIEHFSLIVPCGIRDYGVTSVERACRYEISVEQTVAPIVCGFRETFRGQAEGMPPDLAGLSQTSRGILQASLDVTDSVC